MPHPEARPGPPHDGLAMPAGTEEEDVAVAVGGGPHLDPDEGLLAKRPGKFPALDLDEIRALRYAAKGRDQVRSGRRIGGSRDVRIEVRVGIRTRSSSSKCS